MQLRALLLCEDVRVEVDGTLTLIGVRNDRLLVRTAGTEPVRLESLMFVLVVGGLTGRERIGYRGTLHGVHNRALGLAYEPHAPTSDEHNFVFAYAPIELPRLGTYQFDVEVEAAEHVATFTHRFHVTAA